MTTQPVSSQSTNCYNNNNYEATELVENLQQHGLIPKKSPAHHKDLRRASILVPLFQDVSKEWFMLFTQRPKHLKSHSGEVCFPGGKQDEDDKNDDVVTALRETTEEIGIDAKHIKPLCRLSTVESVSGLCVTPIVGVIDNEISVDILSNLKLSQNEVDSAFMVPINYFSDESNCHSRYDIEWRTSTFPMMTYYYDDNDGLYSRSSSSENQEEKRTYKIWGLTALVAYQTVQVINNGSSSSN